MLSLFLFFKIPKHWKKRRNPSLVLKFSRRRKAFKYVNPNYIRVFKTVPLLIVSIKVIISTIIEGSNKTSEVEQVNVGNAFSIASFVVARGKTGKRFVFPRAHFIVRQLNTTHQKGSRGTYFEIFEIEHLIVNIQRLYSGFTGQTVKCISTDLDRGGLLNSQQGYIYGISDVVTKNFVEIY